MYCDIRDADIGVYRISGTTKSDTTSCDIRTPNNTSDIDSDIGDAVISEVS